MKMLHIFRFSGAFHFRPSTQIHLSMNYNIKNPTRTLVRLSHLGVSWQTGTLNKQKSRPWHEASQRGKVALIKFCQRGLRCTTVAERSKELFAPGGLSLHRNWCYCARLWFVSCQQLKQKVDEEAGEGEEEREKLAKWQRFSIQSASFVLAATLLVCAIFYYLFINEGEGCSGCGKCSVFRGGWTHPFHGGIAIMKFLNSYEVIFRN